MFVHNQTFSESQIAPMWVNSPSTHGTSDLLWSCVVTLSACIYTAIHLNVPLLPEGKLHMLWTKINWVGLALFAPEIVLYTAVFQFYKAWTFVKKMNKFRRDERDMEAKVRDNILSNAKRVRCYHHIELSQQSNSIHHIHVLIIFGGSK